MFLHLLNFLANHKSRINKKKSKNKNNNTLSKKSNKTSNKYKYSKLKLKNRSFNNSKSNIYGFNQFGRPEYNKKFKRQNYRRNIYLRKHPETRAQIPFKNYKFKLSENIRKPNRKNYCYNFKFKNKNKFKNNKSKHYQFRSEIYKFNQFKRAEYNKKFKRQNYRRNRYLRKHPEARNQITSKEYQSNKQKYKNYYYNQFKAQIMKNSWFKKFTHKNYYYDQFKVQKKKNNQLNKLKIQKHKNNQFKSKKNYSYNFFKIKKNQFKYQKYSFKRFIKQKKKLKLKKLPIYKKNKTIKKLIQKYDKYEKILNKLKKNTIQYKKNIIFLNSLKKKIYRLIKYKSLFHSYSFKKYRYVFIKDKIYKFENIHKKYNFLLSSNFQETYIKNVINYSRQFQKSIWSYIYFFILKDSREKVRIEKKLLHKKNNLKKRKPKVKIQNYIKKILKNVKKRNKNYFKNSIKLTIKKCKTNNIIKYFSLKRKLFIKFNKFKYQKDLIKLNLRKKYLIYNGKKFVSEKTKRRIKWNLYKNTFGINIKAITRIFMLYGINKYFIFSNFRFKNSLKNLIFKEINLLTKSNTLKSYLTENRLFFLEKIKNYKSLRHLLRYPSRGQRTHTNANTRKNIKKNHFSSVLFT